MRLSIPFHSVVDIITNSSTVVYTWASAGAQAMVEGIIDEVLQQAGSTKKSTDLYKVSVVVSKSSIEEFVDMINDLTDEEVADGADGLDPRIATLRELYDGEKDWAARTAEQCRFARENFTLQELSDEIENRYRWENSVIETEIVVESLDGTDSKIDEVLPNLFETMAIQDG